MQQPAEFESPISQVKNWCALPQNSWVRAEVEIAITPGSVSLREPDQEEIKPPSAVPMRMRA